MTLKKKLPTGGCVDTLSIILPKKNKRPSETRPCKTLKKGHRKLLGLVKVIIYEYFVCNRQFGSRLENNGLQSPLP